MNIYVYVNIFNINYKYVITIIYFLNKYLQALTIRYTGKIVFLVKYSLASCNLNENLKHNQSF